jgi:hypothetical protein
MSEFTNALSPSVLWLRSNITHINERHLPKQEVPRRRHVQFFPSHNILMLQIYYYLLLFRTVYRAWILQ